MNHLYPDAVALLRVHAEDYRRAPTVEIPVIEYLAPTGEDEDEIEVTEDEMDSDGVPLPVDPDAEVTKPIQAGDDEVTAVSCRQSGLDIRVCGCRNCRDRRGL